MELYSQRESSSMYRGEMNYLYGKLNINEIAVGILYYDTMY